MFRRAGVQVLVLVVLMSGWYRLARAVAATADGAASAHPMKAVRMRPPARRPATREAVFAAEESMVLVGRRKMPYLRQSSYFILEGELMRERPEMLISFLRPHQ